LCLCVTVHTGSLSHVFMLSFPPGKMLLLFFFLLLLLPLSLRNGRDLFPFLVSLQRRRPSRFLRPRRDLSRHRPSLRILLRLSSLFFGLFFHLQNSHPHQVRCSPSRPPLRLPGLLRPAPLPLPRQLSRNLPLGGWVRRRSHPSCQSHARHILQEAGASWKAGGGGGPERGERERERER